VLVLCFLLYHDQLHGPTGTFGGAGTHENGPEAYGHPSRDIADVFFLSMALLGIPASYLVDRWSRRKTMSLIAIIWSAFTYITGLAEVSWCAFASNCGGGWRGRVSCLQARLCWAPYFLRRQPEPGPGIFNAFHTLGSAMELSWRVSFCALWGLADTFFVFAVPGIILGILAFFLKDYKTVAVTDEHGKTGRLLVIRWPIFSKSDPPLGVYRLRHAYGHGLFLLPPGVRTFRHRAPRAIRSESRP